MDRLNKILKDFSSAVNRLEKAINKAKEFKGSEEYSFYRDSAIQRFEFTFELMWKVLKVFLEKEGILCRSPRSCIRAFFNAGYSTEEETRLMLKMVEDRNLTVHTYNEKLAEEIFSRLESYVKIFRSIYETIEDGSH
ncbi:HI0074 family nucleotidyltransferase substrate-binding subunit [Aquifex aeolicus]|uniref:HI0074 family nucleotidyltransferase substrate-binding subunit n=1 Tax=Aquifex aeolicus TaxID=63363 RepID=UPI0013E8AE1B|nr:HI0074 family nucleotidyltransferase substrate-binding subunit [Aquifex aeolicus]